MYEFGVGLLLGFLAGIVLFGWLTWSDDKVHWRRGWIDRGDYEKGRGEREGR